MADELEGMTLEIRDHVAELTFTRPQLMNRIDDAVHLELARAFRRLDANPEVRVAVLAAEGKYFSAGGDFDLMMQKHDDLAVRWSKGSDGIRLLTTLLDVRVPVVAAVHGDAIGLGASIALACDAVISHPTCRIFDPHVRMGLVAGDGGCLVWPASAGMMRAKKYLLTGDPLSAKDALEMGLITELVATPEDVLAAARAFAARLAALPPLAVQATKRSLNRVLHSRLNEVIELGFAYQMAVLGSDDVAEAISAFKEKRPPNFKGR